MNLVREFSNYDLHIDLLTLKANSEHFSNIPESVNVRPLTAKHSLTCIPEVAHYLRKHKPNALLVAKDRAGRAALTARKIAGTNTRIVIRLGTNLSQALKQRSKFNRWFRLSRIRRSYRYADAIVAVSNGVAIDVHLNSKFPRDKIHVIRNPVITAELLEHSKMAVDHPWLADQKVPVIMGAGRLTHQKDFATLINAFAILRKNMHCRLIIVGEGKLRDELTLQIEQLGLVDDVQMPGFKKSWHTWLARASVFVLSSLWEGSPNTLTEALALGVPSVSTRCPSGPDETLKDGAYGELVELGDAVALAAAIEKTLAKPLAKQTLVNAVHEYNVEHSALSYLKVLQISPIRIENAAIE